LNNFLEYGLFYYSYHIQKYICANSIAPIYELVNLNLLLRVSKPQTSESFFIVQILNTINQFCPSCPTLNTLSNFMSIL